MKKLFVYRIRKQRRLWTLLKISFYQAIGYRVFVWGDQELPLRQTARMAFPSALNSINFEEASRKLSFDYFVSNQAFFDAEIYQLDYIRKCIDIYALDYFAFEHSLKDSTRDGDRVRKIAPPLLSSIHSGSLPRRNFWIIVDSVVVVVRLTIRLIKVLFTRLRQVHPSIPLVLCICAKKSNQTTVNAHTFATL